MTAFVCLRKDNYVDWKRQYKITTYSALRLLCVRLS